MIFTLGISTIKQLRSNIKKNKKIVTILNNLSMNKKFRNRKLSPSLNK